MIAIRDLEFRYKSGDFRLKVDRLNFHPGSKHAIVGPSGSGKTTLLNLLAGIDVPDAGEIQLDDKTISNFDDHQRRKTRIDKIGMVFQRFELVEYLNTLDNIILPFLIDAKLNLNSSIRDRAKRLTEQLGIGSMIDRYPGQLSQGEQQRVAICRALINDPQIILADEPTGNLDPKNKGVIMDTLFRTSEQNQQTLIVVTHDNGILHGFDSVIDFESLATTDE